MLTIEFGTYRPIRPEALPLIEAGDALYTITSNQSGQHSTVRLRCFNADQQVPWERADHVDITDFDGGQIATYRPRTGTITLHSDAGGREVWTAGAVIRWLAGRFPLLDQLAAVDCMDYRAILVA